MTAASVADKLERGDGDDTGGGLGDEPPRPPQWVNNVGKSAAASSPRSVLRRSILSNSTGYGCSDLAVGIYDFRGCQGSCVDR